MVRNGVNSPRASSCGRLFDAVAAALNICRERQAYEGEAGARLEAIVDPDAMRRDDEESAYPFSIPNLRDTGLPYIEPLAMWRALLGDLILKTPPPLMAARFHKGLAKAIVAMATKLARRDDDERSPLRHGRSLGRLFPEPRSVRRSRPTSRAAKTSPYSRIRAFPPTTAASRSARRRSAPRISSTRGRTTTTLVKQRDKRHVPQESPAASSESTMPRESWRRSMLAASSGRSTSPASSTTNTRSHPASATGC